MLSRAQQRCTVVLSRAQRNELSTICLCLEVRLLRLVDAAQLRGCAEGRGEVRLPQARLGKRLQSQGIRRVPSRQARGGQGDLRRGPCARSAGHRRLYR